jgi:glycosyltransferase involved in cell wall biosynthesis
MTAPAPRLGPPIIGFLGRLLPEKGPDLLIDALAILKAKGVRFGARIAGDGAIKSEVAARAAASGLVDMVTWLGWVEALPAFFESIDVLCVPSRHESFGLVLLEAFAAGKPVVATRTVGPSETVVEGRNGLLCDIDAVDIAAKLETLLRDPARLTQLGAQARIDAAGYAMPAVAPNVAAVLTGLIRARALAPMA